MGKIITKDHEFSTLFLRDQSSSFKVENGQDVLLFAPSVEHAFQASKTLDSKIQKEILSLNSFDDIRKIGKSLMLVDDWDDSKLDIMERLLTDKFEQHFDLKLKLMLTGTDTLVVDNKRDLFWGYSVDREMGENHLGLLLMKIRDNYLKDHSAMDLFLQFLDDYNLRFMVNYPDLKDGA